ncbi:MAG: rRNA ((967)-C(5))-methyltransferase [Actinomycetia bacterium]|nr:rRNA ((967)-C(5))-methyltransferase [Actinomycetes bacterium]
MSSARATALEALVRIDGGAFTHIVVPQLLARSRLSPRDRASVTAFVYGAVRMQGVLDDALAGVSKRPLGELDPPVRAALRLGAFQLFDGVAPHAAVGETVSAAPERARSFVNGVLRGLARTNPVWPVVDADTPDADLGAITSHPDWIARMLLEAFGRDDTVAMLHTDNRPPAVTLRPNPLRTNTSTLMAQLGEAGVGARPGNLLADSIVLDAPRDPGALEAVRAGCATPQDQASQAVVEALDPQPGERVADLAAAPGGKATAAAEAMADTGIVVAADVHAGRIDLVRDGAARLRLNAVVPIVADGRRPPLRERSFDRVLLDAPCSGLGVLRRRPDARWRITEHDVHELAELQRDLLARAARLVRPGGRLVYSVCTITAAETLAIDEWASGTLEGFEALAPPGAPWRAHGRGALLLPHDADTDGMFVLSLQAPG